LRDQTVDGKFINGFPKKKRQYMGKHRSWKKAAEYRERKNNKRRKRRRGDRGARDDRDSITGDVVERGRPENQRRGRGGPQPLPTALTIQKCPQVT